ncbi:MAG: FliM/FliN family flagellar motor C-terminal domain-containing protein, partial [Armatimonadota bacterium]|nr:FliM/FliN family flagellar motor C-terminal domain-containing protein [Armatimonadota bacterium]
IARLGVASLNVADLANLQVGQVVPMQVCPPPDGEPAPKARLGAVDLVVGEQVKFRGRTGLRGRKLAVQVEQIVAAPVELITHFE